MHPLTISAPSLQLPLTICVLAYGPHAKLAERFLRSLYDTTEPKLFQLRAGMNEAEPKTRSLFESYAGRFGNVELFIESINRFKSPLMRRMFYQPPITTKWTIWCDDDTHFTRSDWFQRLALKIEAAPETAMWGMLHKLWHYDEFVREWIQAAAWYRGLPLLRGLDLKGKEATEFQFATGGFWAIRTEILYQLNWPDSRLVQAHDDFLLGEALRQNGLAIGGFHYGVQINDAPRRNHKAREVTGWAPAETNYSEPQAMSRCD
jgi:GT2 family glycosyltransferase